MAKIMLVEDDNNLSEIYQARMMAEGYTVVSAHDGEEALALAAKEKPDLIISDVMMPKISGFEMLDILRNTQGLKDTKVIMLTALGQAEDKTRADSLGADRYLVKSQVTLEDIVKSAQELLTADGVAGVPAAQSAAPTATAAPVQTPVVTPPATTPTAPVAVTPAPAAMPVTQPPVAAPSMAAAPAPAVPVAPQPTVVTPPTPSPVTQPAPQTPAPAVIPTPDANTQSMAQENAAIQNQIASFEQTPAPAAPTQPANTPEAVDDKIVTDAVNTLVANTPNAAPAPEQSQPAQATPQTPAPAPVADTPDVTLSDTATDDDPNPATRRKIIKPIETDGQKPDLNSLLAAEEAKASQTGIVSPMSTQQAAAGPAHQPGNIYAPTPESAPQNTGIDPNSISL